MFPYYDQERKQWQDPVRILRGMGLSQGMTFADIGCGRGFFAIPAAEIVGPGGRVYGVDADFSAIADLGKEASSLGLNNIELKAGMAEDTLICNSCLDIVFFGICLHDFEDANAVLSNAKRMLKRDGLLVDLDWKKEPMPIGPPIQKRFSEECASRLIEAAGFRIESVGNSGAYHYIIKARIG